MATFCLLDQVGRADIFISLPVSKSLRYVHAFTCCILKIQVNVLSPRHLLNLLWWTKENRALHSALKLAIKRLGFKVEYQGPVSLGKFQILDVSNDFYRVEKHTNLTGLLCGSRQANCVPFSASKFVLNM